MDNKDKPAKKQRQSRMSDEELTTLEVSEDRRLRRLGIDPDGDPADIMKELRRRMDQRETERQAKQEADRHSQ